MTTRPSPATRRGVLCCLGVSASVLGLCWILVRVTEAGARAGLWQGGY